MSDTYIGWDGKSYPWPPPDGWYHASDGRWWAPGTGPNPPPQEVPPTALAPSHGQAAPAPHSPNPAAVTTSELRHGFAAAPHDDPLATRPVAPQDHADQVTSVFTPADAGRTAVFSPPGGSPGPDLTPIGGITTPAAPLDGPPNLGGPGPIQIDPSSAGGGSSGGGIGQALLIIVGIVAVVLIGGFAYFYFTADQDADVTSAGAEAPTDSETSGTLGSGPQPDETTAEDSTDSSAQSPDTTDDTAVDEPEDSAATTTPAEDEGASTTADLGPPVDRFRAILEDNGLTSNNLSSQDIQDFASSFCRLAESADDSDAFDVIREAAVDSSSSQLSAGELRLVIDTAVLTFCPEQATRLDIEL